MQNILKSTYRLFLSHQDAGLNSIINVLFIFITAAIAWWIFNLVISRLEKRYRDYPFFQKNKQFFILLRKAGHYTILILVGVGLVNLTHVPIIEKLFYAIMILLLASFTDGLTKNLLPYLEENLASRTDSKIDDVIFGLLNKFASIIIFVTAGILALDVLGVNIMPFIAGAGAAGIAIGFAAKDTLSNVIAGILLIIDRPAKSYQPIQVKSHMMPAVLSGKEFAIPFEEIRTDNSVESDRSIWPTASVFKRY